MKVRDIEARRAELAAQEDSNWRDGRLLELYEEVLDAISKSGLYPPAAQANAALGRPRRKAKP